MFLENCSDGLSPCITDIVLSSIYSDISFKRLQPDSETIGEFFPRETKETENNLLDRQRWMEDRGGEMKSLFGGKEDVISPKSEGKQQEDPWEMKPRNRSSSRPLTSHRFSPHRSSAVPPAGCTENQAAFLQNGEALS